jgi:hypothetical protein
LVPNSSTSVKRTLAAEGHPTEGQFLLKEETKLRKLSDIPNRTYKT